MTAPTVPAAGARGGVELDLALPLEGFDLSVRCSSAARSLGVFGPSGSGKTSLLEAVAGWRPRARGLVRLAGRALLDTAAGTEVPIERRGIGYVPQDALLFPHRTVEGNLACARGRRRGAAAVDPARAVEVLGIGGLLGRSVRTLSGGERQRVALARALCSDPDFLLLDEPFGALDRELRRRVLPYLLRVREEFDLPMLFVSHDATEVQALCDEVLVLECGRAVALGPAAETLRARAGGDAGYANVLRGEVLACGDGVARVAVAPGVEVHAPAVGLVPGSRAVVAVGADDVLLARGGVERISARNRIAGRVARLAEAGEDARADVEVAPGVVVSSIVTRDAARELALEPGAEVRLLFKTRSCRVLS